MINWFALCGVIVFLLNVVFGTMGVYCVLGLFEAYFYAILNLPFLLYTTYMVIEAFKDYYF